jgi:hypothetical protein
MLKEFIAANRAEIISRCRAKVAVRPHPGPVRVGIDRGVPMFLDQLLDELGQGPSSKLAITSTARQHGHDLLIQGYTVSQVVHDYGDVCQSITELAVERSTDISTNDFRTLNRCLDDAIAGAVTEYGRQRQPADDPAGVAEGVRVETSARDLLKALKIAKVAFEAIKSGKVGIAGSTSGVLGLGLDTAHDLAQRLVVDLSQTDRPFVTNGR